MQTTPESSKPVEPSTSELRALIDAAVNAKEEAEMQALLLAKAQAMADDEDR